MDELIEKIETYDTVKHKEEMKVHHKEMGNLEDGHATERACDLIIKLCGENNNEKV